MNRGSPCQVFWSAPAPVFAALRRGLGCSLPRRSRRRGRERSGDGALDFLRMDREPPIKPHEFLIIGEIRLKNPSFLPF